MLHVHVCNQYNWPVMFVLCIQFITSPFQNIRVATSLMIPSYSVSCGSDYVKLKWAVRHFRPESFEITYSCSVRQVHMAKNEQTHYVNKTIRSISSNATIIKICDLRPSSVCILNLLAVYNPASIDSGIDIIASTLAVHESKCDSDVLIYCICIVEPLRFFSKS